MAVLTEADPVISREELEYVLVPWFGRKYERWVRLRARPDPVDPQIVHIPADIYAEYRARPQMSPLTSEQKRRFGVRDA